MIEHEYIAAKWWRWWANPFDGLHADRLQQLESQGISAKEQNCYEVVSRVRRMLAVPSVPDELMTSATDKLLCVLLDADVLTERLAGLGCIALNDNILTARSQDWEDMYQVHDSGMIRDLVFSLRSLTPLLETIRLDILAVLPAQLNRPLTVKETVTIVLGLYLREFSLPLYQRWLLTISRQAEATLAQIPRMNKEHVSDFIAWVDARLVGLIEDFKKTHDIPLLDLNDLRDDHAEAA